MTDQDSAMTILYAEDDPDDRLLAEMAHRDSGSLNPLVFVRDAEEALEYLRRTGRYAHRVSEPQPGIVVLDLNMPGMNGHAALGLIRSDPWLRRLPVVMLTTSSAQSDIVASFDAGANSYIVKPSGFPSLVQIFELLDGYWFGINSLALEITP